MYRQRHPRALSAARHAALRRKTIRAKTAATLALVVGLLGATLPTPSRADLPSEEFAFKLCMMERSGALDTDRLRLARSIVTERIDQIALFTRYGHLSPTELAAKRDLIDTVTNEKLAALIPTPQREDWEAWSRQIFDVSQRLPVAPRSAGASRRGPGQ
jgi:hypothetical protein